MDGEEFIIYDYDENTIKKEVEEIEDPLSVEEVPVHDPLDPETHGQEESDVAIKEEAITSWNRKNEVENEGHQELIKSVYHPDDALDSREAASPLPYPDEQNRTKEVENDGHQELITSDYHPDEALDSREATSPPPYLDDQKRTNGVDNEEHQELITSDHHLDDVPVSREVESPPSYYDDQSRDNGVESENDQEVNSDHHPDNDPVSCEAPFSPSPREGQERPKHEPSRESPMAPFISNRMQSPLTPPKSPRSSAFDAVARSGAGEAGGSPEPSVSNLPIDQPTSADFNSPEIICVDSDSENEQRDSQQCTSSNSNSEWSTNVQVSDISGTNVKPDNNREEPGTKNEVSVIKKAVKKLRTRKKKQAKRETSSSILPVPPADVPVPPAEAPVNNQSVKVSRKRSAQQRQQPSTTLPTYLQVTASRQPNEQDSLRKQTPLQQLLSVRYSPLLGQQQPFVPSRSPQFVSQQQPGTSVQFPQLLTQKPATSTLGSQLPSQPPVTSVLGSQLPSQKPVTSVRGSQLPSQPPVTSVLGSQLPSQPPIVISVLDPQFQNQQSLAPVNLFEPSENNTAEQSAATPPLRYSFSWTSNAKKPKLTAVKDSQSEDARATASPQTAASMGSVTTESQLVALKHKMEVQELKLRLRNAKVRAELEEAEMKLRMESSMQELANKKLKHDILAAKLHFYSKLCAAEKL
ncbi:histone acetyltransferase KAT6A-like [Bacillus rossius redtenbacheri]|uniref:histone acetyltransferase KAT6A-like n=1 Tax=Bacillus rossius redtenbacheri TaxID=93214 RepID=UPI002FDD3A9A